MDLSYPIGRFDFNKPWSRETVSGLIEEIAAAPGTFREAVRGLDEAQLDTPYRPGRLDGAADGTPRCGQPHEQLHPLPPGADRGRARRSSPTTKRRGANWPIRARRRWSGRCN